MTRNIIISLLAPLLLIFSINASALHDSEAHGFLKTGVLETLVEIPTPEVTPDLDHALTQASADSPQSLGCLSTFSINTDPLSASSNTLFCRGPPLYL